MYDHSVSLETLPRLAWNPRTKHVNRQARATKSRREPECPDPSTVGQRPNGIWSDNQNLAPNGVRHHGASFQHATWRNRRAPLARQGRTLVRICTARSRYQPLPKGGRAGWGSRFTDWIG